MFVPKASKSRSRSGGWAAGMALVCACAFAQHALPSDISPDLIRRVELKWEEQEKATQYELELSLNPEFTRTLYTERIQETRFNVDLLPGAYYYRVRAVDKNSRPGRWTPIQELKINARPPKLKLPIKDHVYQGNLPDSGIGLEWRSSGPGIKYLVEIKSRDASGQFGSTVVKQEVDDTEFPFFPSLPGEFQWTVSTLGAGGDEPGESRAFRVEGIVPRGVEPKAGEKPVRVVRYVPPFWRGHWTLYARYGQAMLGYSIVDQDFRASGSFTGITGFATLTLNYEWHDPVCLSPPRIVDGDKPEWRHIPSSGCFGIPWFEYERSLDRQTVLSESILLKRGTARLGTWFDEFKGLEGWRFSPVIEYGTREYAYYQPLSPVAAVRSNTKRTALGTGIAVEKRLKPYLVVGGSFKMLFESGGLSGIYPVAGIYDISNRAGTLQSSTGFEAIGKAAMQFGRRIKVEGRLRFERATQTWTGYFPTASGDPLTHAGFTNVSFDVGVGIKF